MAVNREYKDSVFTLLFNDKARLLELYNAINGANYTDRDGVEINTLEDALFMGRKNDISFLIADVLVVLIEHQSTINPNMPLRLLMYISRIYEKIIDNKQLYTSRKMDIPRPEFIVLYNGKEDFPGKKVLKLSGLFKEAEGYDKAALELEVTVYNINKGVNPAIEERSPTLSGYAELVEKARENEGAGMDREEAVKEAMLFCVSKGILGDFLKDHGSEVENMLLTEWNWDDALQVRWEEGREEGHGEIKEMVLNLIEQGKSLDELKTILKTSSTTTQTAH